MMNYEINVNPVYNSLEISFSGKPSEEIRNILKGHKFRWHGQKKVWYGFADAEELKKELNGEPLQASAQTVGLKKSGKKYSLTPEDKEEIRRNYAQAWSDDRMIDFCTNQVDKLLRVGDLLVIFEKKSLKKSFCYGYGFYGRATEEEMDRAGNNARITRENPDVFIEENTSELKEKIELIQYILRKRHETIISSDEDYNYRFEGLEIVFKHHGYYGEKPHNLTEIGFMKKWEIVEASGGQMQALTDSESYRVATDEEAEKVLEVLEEQLSERLKRCETYLKKYGTSKLNVWTYLRD